MNQSEKILKALKSGRQITPLDALNEFGCFRLAAVIFKLKKEGYNIKTEIINSPNGKHYARYSIEVVYDKSNQAVFI